ncbi:MULTISPECIES: hypothetical protein [unclassified Lysinibacillus]|uniref:hypothetical protein n=1 Tax=unclassified Lysinibacillus TaxID=2636778 RepID=UPI00201330E6|nr:MULTISPECIES: hypothetical protein [unclassified Lysinibacillus]MCL1696445.1 hypothetical protein [Lysinibacillus sp. BPa_S21]MCL1700370.1 hypothetical protein [Lysinibacillus sp. Bpr_S20]
MDEFENIMAEFNDWLVDVKKQIKDSGKIDQSKLDVFVKVIAELVSIKHKYADKLLDLRNATEKKIVRLEYSKGGETIHRGYYCPSPVLDLIVGGMKRGRLFKKKKPKFGNYTYEYGFDKDGRLLRVKGVNEFTTPDSRFDEEYLIYIDDIVYGLEFDNSGELVVVSKCIYENGKLMKYERSGCWTEEFADLQYEEYTYENNWLSEVDFFYNIDPLLELYEEERLRVENDEVGNIIRIIGSTIVEGKSETHIYNVKPLKK